MTRILAALFLAQLLLVVQPAAAQTSAPATLDDVAKLRAEVEKLKNELANSQNKPDPGTPMSSGWRNQTGGLGTAYPEQICPDGSYAAGIRAWGSTPDTRYCIGCLTGVAILCKPFPR